MWSRAEISDAVKWCPGTELAGVGIGVAFQAHLSIVLVAQRKEQAQGPRQIINVCMNSTAEVQVSIAPSEALVLVAK